MVISILIFYEFFLLPSLIILKGVWGRLLFVGEWGEKHKADSRRKENDGGREIHLKKSSGGIFETGNNLDFFDGLFTQDSLFPWRNTQFDNNNIFYPLCEPGVADGDTKKIHIS